MDVLLELPKFPAFRNLTPTDRQAIINFTSNYPPYSDFNFTSLLAYNIEECFLVSNLNGNFAMKLFDYLTSVPFYTFLGGNQSEDAIERLLHRSIKEHLEPTLRLVPASSIETDYEQLIKHYEIIEDRDNFDYIIEIDKLVKLDFGHRYKKRKEMERFKKRSITYYSKIIDLSESIIQRQVKELLITWKGQRSSSIVTDIESKAIERLMKYSANLPLMCLGAYVDDKLVGFIVNELIHDGYYISHFGKCDHIYNGAEVYLENESAMLMQRLGCMLMNNEQDLGIDGLRKHKMSWQPIKFLKKYNIRHGRV